MGADVAVILTEWNVFRGLDLTRLRDTMRSPILVDFRNLFSLEDIADSGLVYDSLGRTRQNDSKAFDKVVLMRSH
jgi:UDPglucose 6-dehydrogenase